MNTKFVQSERLYGFDSFWPKTQGYGPPSIFYQALKIDLQSPLIFKCVSENIFFGFLVTKECVC